MTREDHVLALFAAANPVPDARNLVVEHDNVAHLGTVETRESMMTVTEERSSGSTPAPQPRRGWLKGAAAAAIMLVVGGSVWALMTPADDDATQVEPEVAAVLTAIDAYNAGDVDGFAAAFDPSAEDVAIVPGTGYFFEILMNANQRIEIVEPCRLLEGRPAVVECTVRVTNEFHGPAGISGIAVNQFLLGDDLRITALHDNLECCAAQVTFNRAFHTWLRDTHPDVFEQIQPSDLGSLPGWRTDAADMSIATQYVEEFVAQSDDYPLDSPSG